MDHVHEERVLRAQLLAGGDRVEQEAGRVQAGDPAKLSVETIPEVTHDLPAKAVTHGMKVLDTGKRSRMMKLQYNNFYLYPPSSGPSILYKERNEITDPVSHGFGVFCCLEIVWSLRKQLPVNRDDIAVL